MATVEQQLVSRIISTGDLASVIKWGITSDDFLDPKSRTYFDQILGYYYGNKTSGSVLGPSLIRERFNHFEFVDEVGMTTEALCQEVRNKRVVLEAQKLQSDLEEVIAADPINGLDRLQAGIAQLQRLGSRSSAFNLKQAYDHVVDTYINGASALDRCVCTYPWEPLTEESQGIQEDDYIVVYGRPKSKKTWVATKLVAHAIQQGKKVLIYTKEMTREGLSDRLIGCLAEIDYGSMRKHRLDAESKIRIADLANIVAKYSEYYSCISGSEVEDSDTVHWLRAKVEEIKPDLVVIDGLYLMTDSRRAKDDHARVRNISRDIRQMVLKLKIPCIATIQANRAAHKNKKANLDEIAFSDAIGQDATLVIRTYAEEINTPDGPVDTIQLIIGGSREFKFPGLRIYGQPAINFGYFGELTDKEINQAQEKEKQELEIANAKVAKLKGKARNKDLGNVVPINEMSAEALYFNT